MSLQNLYLWVKYLAQIARPCGLTPTAGTPRVSAWTCTRIRQHLIFDEENMASKSCPGMVGRAAPDANLFCIKAVKTAFFFCYNLQVFPRASLWSSQLLRLSHLGITIQPSRVSQEGAHLKILFLFPVVSHSPASTSSLGLKQQSDSVNTPVTWSAFCLPSSLPKGL